MKLDLGFKISFLIVILISINGISQNVGINNTGVVADPSAALDVVSANKGLLIPRVALTAINSPLPITSPLTSLMVYNTAIAGAIPNNVVPGYYYWDGAKWLSINGSVSGGLNWNLLGNSGTNSITNFLGTIDNQDLVFRTNNTEKMRILINGNVGINTNAPTEKLHVSQGNIKLTNNAFSSITNASYNNTSGHPVFMGLMARGTEASPVYPNLGDALNSFIGRDAIDYATATYGGAGIYMHATENFSSTKKGTDITFHNTPNGSNLIVQRAIINHNGYVGIGTATPISLLANTANNVIGSDLIGVNVSSLAWTSLVNGYTGAFYNGGVGATANGLAVKVAGNAATNKILDLSVGPLQALAGTPVLTALGNGRVGIGTNTPNYNLQVATSIATGIAGVNAGSLSFLPNNSNSFFHIDNRSDNTLRFSHGSFVGTSDIMTITQINIGIGTTTPNNRLEITSAAANTSGLRFTNLTSVSPTTSSNGKSLSVDVNGDVILVPSSSGSSNDWSLTGNAGTTAGTNFIGTNDNQDLVFKTNSTEWMRLKANGYFGIGTLSPNDKLTVFVPNSASPVAAMSIDVNTFSTLANAQASYFFRVRDIGATFTPFYIRGDGNVGIATTAPSFRLDVNGTTACTGNVWTSDVRKKKNINSLSLKGLDIIKNLNPVTFEWKEVLDDGMKGIQMGFIAQELEKVLPSIVLTENNTDQSKVVKYNELLPVLVKALQEQQKLIEEMQAKIEKLEKK